jgi:uncharacterized protein YndB with AHSA1/START domain
MTTADSDTIFIEQEFSVSADKVWEAWTEPLLVSKWFGSDPNGKVLSAKMDVQPGGNFEVTFANSDGAEHTCSGIYKEVQPFNKLSFTWEWKNEPAVQSFVIVLLQPDGNNTLMQFEHAHVGFASAHNYLEGWNSTFLKLGRVLVGMK